MGRLKHTDIKSYLTTLRMTQVDLVVFIEGKENDPIFYTRIKDRYEAEQQVAVQIRAASEFPTATQRSLRSSGGKQLLLRGADFLQGQRARSKVGFHSRFLFALDKDIDDIVGVIRKEPFFVYTEGYAVENYLVRSCDLAEVAELAFSLFPGRMRTIIPIPQSRWETDVAQLWKEWLVFCIAVRRFNSKTIRSYGQTSRLNKPARNPTDRSAFQQAVEELRREANIDSGVFDDVLTRIDRFVQLKIATGEHDAFFKGEWYVDVLYSQFEGDQNLVGQAVNVGKNGVWSAIRSKFELKADTYLHYRSAFLAAP